MILLYVLIAWWCFVVITLATDSIVIYRTLTGRKGEAPLALFLEFAEQHGGTRRWVVVNLIMDLSEPWVIWQGMLSARRYER